MVTTNTKADPKAGKALVISAEEIGAPLRKERTQRREPPDNRVGGVPACGGMGQAGNMVNRSGKGRGAARGASPSGRLLAQAPAHDPPARGQTYASAV